MKQLTFVTSFSYKYICPSKLPERKCSGFFVGVTMNTEDLEKWIQQLIHKNEVWRFYKSKEWITLKNEILKEHHHECYECKKHGKITRYDVDEDGNKRLLSTVHHVQFVRKHPSLALSKTYTYKGETYLNLIPVCKACHNKLHPEKRNRKQPKEEQFTNEERW